jgi:hypothetical protein
LSNGGAGSVAIVKLGTLSHHWKLPISPLPLNNSQESAIRRRLLRYYSLSCLLNLQYVVNPKNPFLISLNVERLHTQIPLPTVFHLSDYLRPHNSSRFLVFW